MTWTQVALMRQRMTVKTTNKDFLIFLYQKFTGVVALSKNTQWKLMHTPKKKGYITTALTQMHRFYMNCSAPQSKLENIHTFSAWLTVFKIPQWAPAYGCQTRTHTSAHTTQDSNTATKIQADSECDTVIRSTLEPEERTHNAVIWGQFNL